MRIKVVHGMQADLYSDHGVTTASATSTTLRFSSLTKRPNISNATAVEDG
jgi:hypothetical protein